MPNEINQHPQTLVAYADSLEYEDILRSIYCGVHETPPWHSFLHTLKNHLDISTATLVLHQPSARHVGALVSVGTDHQTEKRYRSDKYDDDPFRDITPNYLFTLDDVISREDLEQTRFYRELLNDPKVNCQHMLAVDIKVPAHGTAKLRITRRQGMPVFSVAEKSLYIRLIPHLKEAISHYAKNAVYKIESKVNSQAINQLLMGIIVLDHRDDIVCINETAKSIVNKSDLIFIKDKQLYAKEDNTRQKLTTTIDKVRAAFESGDEQDIGAIRLSASDPVANADLQLLLRPFLLPEYHYTSSDIGIAIFIGDGEPHHSLSLKVVCQLFDLSRAESMLVLKLCEGVAVGQAAHALNISTNTARSQLRSIYEKTGVHRMSELTGMILRSMANLG